MAVPVLVPKLGMSMSTAVLAEWYQRDGATVHHGDPVFRIETDCVAVDIEAEDDGILRQRVGAGAPWPAGEVVGVLLGAGERLPRSFGVDAVAVDDSPPMDAVADAATPASEGFDTEPRDEWADAELAPAEPEASSIEQVRSDLEPVILFPQRREHPQHGGVAAMPVDETGPGDPVSDQGVREAAPGDSPEFESTWFDESFSPAAHTQDAFRAPDSEFGIEEAEAETWEQAVEPATAGASPVPESDAEVAPAVERRAGVGPAPGAHCLRTAVNMVEAIKMRDQLAREWSASGVCPTNEDVVLRAVARAVVETGGARRSGDLIGLRVLHPEGQAVYAVSDVAGRSFRDAVEGLAQLVEEGGPGADAYICTLTSLAEFGIEDSVPQLVEGQALALSMGAPRTVLAFDDDHVARVPVLTLSLAYDARLVPESAAAHLLARVRDLVEAPYALLVA